jgi:hypothetical protein
MGSKRELVRGILSPFRGEGGATGLGRCSGVTVACGAFELPKASLSAPSDGGERVG